MAEGPRVRTVVVDDSTVVRQGLPLLHPELDVIGAYPTIEPLLAQPHPGLQLVVLDLKLRHDEDREGPRQGVTAIRAVSTLGVPICLYTDERRRLVLAQCLRAGAAGVVHKADPIDDARAAFSAVADGQVTITPSLIGLAELVERRGGLPDLTTRQRQVLAARARGERWSSIAARLFITEGVAREHLATASAKFSQFLRDASPPGDMERALGLAPGDLLDDQGE